MLSFIMLNVVELNDVAPFFSRTGCFILLTKEQMIGPDFLTIYHILKKKKV